MKNKRGGVLILLGLLMVAAAAVLAAFNCYDQDRAAQAAVGAAAELRAILAGGEEVSGPTAGEDEVSTAGAAGEEAVAPEEVPDSGEEESDAAQDSEEISETSVPDYVLSPDAEMPVQKIRGRNYIGILQIPAHGLELPILAEWSYPGLRVAPCRYSGSAYKDNMVIAAHNYYAHFGKLKHFSIGETVVFTDMDGNTFVYEIVERETLKPADVEEMKSGDWDLTLFTCTGGGAYRLTVRCECVGMEPSGRIPG